MTLRIKLKMRGPRARSHGIAASRRGAQRRRSERAVGSRRRRRAADERLARVCTAMVEAVARNLELERVFRLAESAEETLRVVREGRERLAGVAEQFIEVGRDTGLFRTADPRRTAGFVITLYDNILYEAWVYAPHDIDAIHTASLRFVLQGVGVAPERVDELVAASPGWRHP